MARRRPNFFEVVGVCAPAIVDPHIAAFAPLHFLVRGYKTVGGVQRFTYLMIGSYGEGSARSIY